jgi:hypothetical protein
MLFIAADTFAQQTDMALIPYRQGDKWGYASADKNIVIAPKYADAGWFSEGLAPVKVGSKWGYINRAGKMVIPAKFTVAKSFRKGYMPNPAKSGGDSVIFAGASIRADGYEQCINTKGLLYTKCPAMSDNAALENHIPVESVVRQKTYTLPNSGGLFDKIVDDYKIDGSDETYYIAQKNDTYGVFNSKFETIVPFQYSTIKVNRSGKQPFLQVTKDGMQGALMTNGSMAITPENTSLVPVYMRDGTEYMIVQRNGKTYVRDLNNKDIIANGYTNIIYDDAGGFILTGDNDLRGYYFLDNTIIQPKYKDVRLVNGTRYLQVKTSNGKVGYISSAGDEYFVE